MARGRLGKAAVVIATGRAAYRWIGDHVDDIDRAADVVVDKTKGTTVEKPAQKSAVAVKKVTSWIRTNRGGGGGPATLNA